MPFWQGTAAITGAGSGLGAAMARRFAAAGLAILALDIDGARAEATAQAIRDVGGNALAARVDVADPAALDDAARLADQELGGCNVLCANVGIQQFGALDRLTPEAWRWVLDVNVLGTVNTVTAFLPLIRQASRYPRRILLTASSAALDPGIRIGAYTASKFAVMGYGETLRLELADEGIGVSILFPAGMDTRHIESSALARPPDLPGGVMSADDLAALTAGSSHNAGSMVSPEHATRHLLDALEAGERYIVTHGQYRAALDDRYRALLAAYDRAQA